MLMLKVYVLIVVLDVVCAAGVIIIALLTPKPKLAASLALSSLNALIVGAALLVGYKPWWTLALWLAAWPLILFTTGYVVADVLKPSTRKQAIIAAVILAPTVAVVWHFSGLLLVFLF